MIYIKKRADRTPYIYNKGELGCSMQVIVASCWYSY